MQRYNEQWQESDQKLDDKSDTFAFRLAIITYIVLFAVILVSVYQTFEEKNKTFIKEHTFVVDTYVCYVTDYGSKYHAEYCQYLYRSKNRTTVYRAKRNGYTACSRCVPRVETRIEVYDANGDTPPKKTEDAVATAIPLLLLSAPVLYIILFQLLKRIYILGFKIKNNY